MKLKVDIKKTFPNNRKFSLEVSFENSDGCFGILGASGSGKTVILKCISGIVSPEAGFISLNDRVLFDSKSKINLKPQERRVGYLFQNYALFPKLTAKKNISIALSSANKFSNCEIEKKVDFWIKSLGLSGMENLLPKELSGGQQQRIALARMLVVEPDAILLDEPFSALDWPLRCQMQTLLKSTLQETNAASIMVTHNKDEALNICQNIALIDNGKIISKIT
ncbi:MAG: hypothetical protein Ta2B_14880 [Termitinemataceae bacterium]|nr:MAG: hypothetical protein Ta2B_14880 [Termitinemataceae bacterium]